MLAQCIKLDLMSNSVTVSREDFGHFYKIVFYEKYLYLTKYFNSTEFSPMSSNYNA